MKHQGRRKRNRHASIAVVTVRPAALRGGAAAGAELRLDLQTFQRCSATCSPGEICEASYHGSCCIEGRGASSALHRVSRLLKLSSWKLQLEVE